MSICDGRCTFKMLFSRQEEAQMQQAESSATNPAVRQSLSLLADRSKQGRDRERNFLS